MGVPATPELSAPASDAPGSSGVDGSGGPNRRRLALDLAWIAALVIAVMAVISRYFWIYEKSIVWRGDGLAQHYPALHFFNQWVRGMIRAPQSGVPLWSWNIGLGADIIGTLAFPVVGDPFALVSLLFPMARLETALAVMLALRVVAAGVAAAAYFRKMGARQLPAAIGVVLYVFSSFLLIQGRHPYFIGAMVFLPLLLLGVELALRDRIAWPLGIFAFLAGISNFYFFYQLTIITVLYAVARYFELTSAQERWRRLFPTAARLGGSYALGSLLAAPLLLPSLAAVTSTARSGGDFVVGLVYPSWVYISQVAGMASGLFSARSTFLGFGYLAWLLLPALFLRRRSNSALKFMIIAFLVFITVPWFGSAFNGFTFPSNRFSFGFGLFLALGVALVLSEDARLTQRDVLAALVCFVAYVVPVWTLGYPLPPLVSAPMVVGVATIAVLATGVYVARGVSDTGSGKSLAAGQPQWMLWALLVLVILNVGVNAALRYDQRYGNVLREYERLGKVQARYTKNLGNVVRQLPKDTFYRVENTVNVGANSAMVQGFPSTSLYFSTMNGHLTELREELDSRPGWVAFSISGFDERVIPTTLFGTRYYLARASASASAAAPFGFRPERTTKRGIVYENDYALPLGFVYQQAINRSDYLRLGPVDRQAAMLRGAVVDDGAVPDVPRTLPSREAVEISYTVAAVRGASFDPRAGRIDRYRKDASIVLSIPPVTDAELYVEMLDFDNVAASKSKGGEGHIIPGTNRTASRWAPDQPDALGTAYRAGLVRKRESWRTPESPYYWGNRSQTVNLGYQTGQVATIGIEPSGVGELTFKSLKVLSLPLEDYPARVDALRANALRDIELGTNRVSGRVNTPSAGLLFLSIPYSTGWSATLDGEPVEVVRANTGFSGIPVSAGEHTVVLRYVTPGLREGLLLAGLAVLGIAVGIVVVAYRRSRATD